MRRDEESRSPTLLERLDLALARRVVEIVPEDSPPEQVVQRARWQPTVEERHRWLVGVLGLRGLRVRTTDVDHILSARPGRILPEHQEHKLVRGLGHVLEAVEDRAAGGRPPDGWFLVDCFRRATVEIGRFHNNHLRRDEPWDGIRGVRYPAPDDLSRLLDHFHEPECFGERPAVFQGLHPVRQAFRLLWRFARLAPFPDFNLSFAFLGATAFLRARGYPLPIPEWSDRTRLERLVVGRPPVRVVQFERRMLELIEPQDRLPR
jgi:hypothetical protein